MESVRAVFNKWDADGSGTIDRAELSYIMKNLSPDWTDEEVYKLMDTIDTDRDGHISFEEFVTWLTDPQASETILSDGWFGTFSFEEAVRPLFSVFDVNGDGRVSFAEFQACYAVIKNSMNLYPSPGPLQILSLDEDAAAEFRYVDEDGDGMMTLQDFVGWQQAAVKRSGTLNKDLPTVFEELAGALQGIVDVDRRSGRGERVSSDFGALDEMARTVARLSHAIFADNERYAQLIKLGSGWKRSKPTARIVQSFWCSPCLSTETWWLLIRTCKEDLIDSLPSLLGGRDLASDIHGSPLKHKRKVGQASKERSSALLNNAVRLIVPDINDARRAPARWLAKVVFTNKMYDQETHIYEKTDRKRWQLLENPAGIEAMDYATKALPEAICLYALLKTRAKMGMEMSWGDVDACMWQAVHMELLEEQELAAYRRQMLLWAANSISEHVREELREKGVAFKTACEDKLEEQRFSPIQALFTLVESDAVRSIDMDETILKQVYLDENP